MKKTQNEMKTNADSEQKILKIIVARMRIKKYVRQRLTYKKSKPNQKPTSRTNHSPGSMVLIKFIKQLLELPITQSYYSSLILFLAWPI